MTRLFFLLAILISSFSFGQVLHDVNTSACSERSYPEFIRCRVIQKELENDTLMLRLGLVLNCCIDPDISIDFEKDSLFIRVDNVSNTVCMCDCCFEITMTFTGFEDDNFQVVYMKPEFNIDSEKFETIYTDYPLEMSAEKYAFPSPDDLYTYKRDSLFLNAVNDQGERIGPWKRYGSEYTYYINYALDENGKSKTVWRATFDAKDELIDICGDNGMGELSCAEPRNYYRLFGYEGSKE